MKNKDYVLPLLSITISLLVIGTVGATLSWYQYNTNTYFNYDGTSIGSSKLFDIGLISDTYLADASKYGLKQDENDSSIYWANSQIDTSTTKYYLSKNGYTTNTLNGVTSGKYSTNGEFSLKRAPEHCDNYFDTFSRVEKATKDNYVHFDFVFRIREITGDGIIYSKDGNIYLNKIELEGEGNIEKSTRFHFANETSNFILNPSVTDDGEDTVGGILDLNKDGLYDYKESLVTGKSYEYYYGETENEDGVVYKDEVTSDGVDEGKGSENSFTGEHKNGVYAIDETKTIAAKSEFLGYDTIITNHQVITTITTDNGLAYLSLDVYLEGWDSYFIDEEQEHKFSLSLEFGVDED